MIQFEEHLVSNRLNPPSSIYLDIGSSSSLPSWEIDEN